MSDTPDFKPKGPFPLFISDFEKDTRGWTGDERWQYLRLLNDLWWNGGFIEDDYSVLAEAMGLNRARNWREKVEKVARKLTSHDEKPGYLTQGKVLKEVLKTAEISRKRAVVGKIGGEKTQAIAKQMVKPPSPSPSPPPSREEPSGSSKRVILDFDAFWKAYPRKVGKKAAFQSWERSKTRPNLEAILSAIDRYVSAKPPDRAYCNPSTWINQERWFDEHDSPASDPKSRSGNGAHQALFDGFRGAAAHFGADDAAEQSPPHWTDNPAGSPRLLEHDGTVDAPGDTAASPGAGNGSDGALLDGKHARNPTGGNRGGLGSRSGRSAVECCRGDGAGVGEDEGAPPDPGSILKTVRPIH